MKGAPADLMRTIMLLLAGSAIMGFVIGLKYRVFVIGLSAPGLAAVAAIALRDFGFVEAAGITFVCLAVSQLAYLVGAWLASRRAETTDTLLGREHPDDRIGENGQPGIKGEQDRDDKPPSYLATY